MELVWMIVILVMWSLRRFESCMIDVTHNLLAFSNASKAELMVIYEMTSCQLYGRLPSAGGMRNGSISNIVSSIRYYPGLLWNRNPGFIEDAMHAG